MAQECYKPDTVYYKIDEHWREKPGRYIVIKELTKEYTLEELTKNKWCNYNRRDTVNLKYRFKFREDGVFEEWAELNCKDSVGRLHSENFYYLSNTLDKAFDPCKIGSKKGKYIIVGAKNAKGRSVSHYIIINITPDSFTRLYYMKPGEGRIGGDHYQTYTAVSAAADSLNGDKEQRFFLKDLMARKWVDCGKVDYKRNYNVTVYGHNGVVYENEYYMNTGFKYWYYLSDTPDSVFVQEKMNSENGRYLITGNHFRFNEQRPDSLGKPNVMEIVKITPDSLLLRRRWKMKNVSLDNFNNEHAYYGDVVQTLRFFSEPLYKNDPLRAKAIAQAKSISLKDLTSHQWGGDGREEYKLNGEVKGYTTYSSSEYAYGYKQSNRFYLSETLDTEFDSTKIGSRKGRFIVQAFDCLAKKTYKPMRAVSVFAIQSFSKNRMEKVLVYSSDSLHNHYQRYETRQFVAPIPHKEYYTYPIPFHRQRSSSVMRTARKEEVDTLILNDVKQVSLDELQGRWFNNYATGDTLRYKTRFMFKDGGEWYKEEVFFPFESNDVYREAGSKSFYLSNTLDSSFKEHKIGSKKGRFLISRDDEGRINWYAVIVCNNKELQLLSLSRLNAPVYDNSIGVYYLITYQAEPVE